MIITYYFNIHVHTYVYSEITDSGDVSNIQYIAGESFFEADLKLMIHYVEKLNECISIVELFDATIMRLTRPAETPRSVAWNPFAHNTAVRWIFVLARSD